MRFQEQQSVRLPGRDDGVLAYGRAGGNFLQELEVDRLVAAEQVLRLYGRGGLSKERRQDGRF